ncbi:unnamed protein product [Amoebophrya sp. A25]|nr:unnamed protein product [Amoebophrya sp. A25]|eukprot:GSA25T00010073001.1
MATWMSMHALLVSLLLLSVSGITVNARASASSPSTNHILGSVPTGDSSSQRAVLHTPKPLLYPASLSAEDTARQGVAYPATSTPATVGHVPDHHTGASSSTQVVDSTAYSPSYAPPGSGPQRVHAVPTSLTTRPPGQARILQVVLPKGLPPGRPPSHLIRRGQPSDGTTTSRTPNTRSADAPSRTCTTPRKDFVSISNTGRLQEQFVRQSPSSYSQAASVSKSGASSSSIGVPTPLHPTSLLKDESDGSDADREETPAAYTRRQLLRMQSSLSGGKNGTRRIAGAVAVEKSTGATHHREQDTHDGTMATSSTSGPPTPSGGTSEQQQHHVTRSRVGPARIVSLPPTASGAFSEQHLLNNNYLGARRVGATPLCYAATVPASSSQIFSSPSSTQNVDPSPPSPVGVLPHETDTTVIKDPVSDGLADAFGQLSLMCDLENSVNTFSPGHEGNRLASVFQHPRTGRRLLVGSLKAASNFDKLKRAGVGTVLDLSQGKFAGSEDIERRVIPVADQKDETVVLFSYLLDAVRFLDAALDDGCFFADDEEHASKIRGKILMDDCCSSPGGGTSGAGGGSSSATTTEPNQPDDENDSSCLMQELLSSTLGISKNGCSQDMRRLREDLQNRRAMFESESEVAQLERRVRVRQRNAAERTIKGGFPSSSSRRVAALTSAFSASDHQSVEQQGNRASAATSSRTTSAGGTQLVRQGLDDDSSKPKGEQERRVTEADALRRKWSIAVLRLFGEQELYPVDRHGLVCIQHEETRKSTHHVGVPGTSAKFEQEDGGSGCLGPFPKDSSRVSSSVSSAGRNPNVLVNCVAGKSRSVTVVLAYLIVVQRYTLREALRTVFAQRSRIYPNVGFFRALQLLERFVHVVPVPSISEADIAEFHQYQKVARALSRRLAQQQGYFQDSSFAARFIRACTTGSRLDGDREDARTTSTRKGTRTTRSRSCSTLFSTTGVDLQDVGGDGGDELYNEQSKNSSLSKRTTSTRSSSSSRSPGEGSSSSSSSSPSNDSSRTPTELLTPEEALSPLCRRHGVSGHSARKTARRSQTDEGCILC